MDRLPSPPPEADDQPVGDVIGSSGYSQRFVLKTLMDVLKESDSSNGTSVCELEQKFDERLCILWDMSSDNEVTGFLNEHNALKIFETIIRQTNKPRLTEILMGITANMLCNKAVCESLKGDEKFCDLVLNLFGCRDTQTLLETTRTFQLCIENGVFLTSIWDEKFVSEDIWEDILFIAKSTTNECLLLAVSRCAESLLENKKCAKNFLEKIDAIVVLIEIIDNCLTEKLDEICSFWLLGLQNLSTDQTLAVSLIRHWDDIFPVVIKVLLHISAEIDTEFSSNSSISTNLACCFSLLKWNCAVINNDDEIFDILMKFEKYFDGNTNDEFEKNQYYDLAKQDYTELMKNREAVKR